MLHPGWPEFRGLAHNATGLVAVVKSVSADLLTPVSAFLAIAETEPRAFLLESVEGGEKIGRYTFLGARPFMQVESKGEQITIERAGKRETKTGNLFVHLKDLLGQYRLVSSMGQPPFRAGAVGYFGYDAVRQLESIGEHARDDLHLPDSVLMFFDRVLAFDHLRHQIHIMAAADVRRESPRRAYDQAVADIAAIEKKLLAGHRSGTTKRSTNTRPIKAHKTTSRETYLRNVQQVQQYILAGDVFQAVLSQRVDFEPIASPFDIYRALRMVNPSPYMYYLRLTASQPTSRNTPFHVLGSSPEMLVRVTANKLEYRPIAGTHPRGKDEAEDKELEQKMRADEKERAEHVMLVDLGRNDLGRVSEYGSVRVRDLMFVEKYSHVMHLVSAIEGRLRPELSALDAFAACFPAGTLTGAPKIRAMQIIEELEPVRRGIYGGSVLYADFGGNLDSCIAIRTMVIKGKRAYLQAGAGIVADSDPASEYQECLNKAQALVKAAELAQRGLS